MRISVPVFTSPLALPLFSSAVRAGFPSPAEDYVEGWLDLNKHLVKRPAATFLVRVAGDSMIGAGIFPGDILVVDRSITATPGCIVIAVLNGELTVKRLRRAGDAYQLVAENPAYPPLAISEDMEVWCWGVVTAAVHEFKGR